MDYFKWIVLLGYFTILALPDFNPSCAYKPNLTNQSQTFLGSYTLPNQAFNIQRVLFKTS